ncbi:helix-turn-helix transcriptional regulator [Halorussus marinus]|uniref:helix-turn-helix transcriptional regulator n=1 Tax=Halorussus marinus TaxID=2505976 RepID=UPI00106DEF1A|nr:hypothetical protein [Halorussus marinus]
MRWFAALLVALLALGPVAGAAAGVGQSTDELTATPLQQSETATETNETHDKTIMRVSLRETGDADWTVTTQFALRDENETAAFRQLAEKYESGETDVGVTSETFERIGSRAAPDRKMAIRDASRSARLLENGTVGRLTLSFTWTNFSRVEDRVVVVDDAFRTPSGTWLPELTRDQSLVIDGPDSYVVRNTPPNKGVSNVNELHYEGPESFEPGEIEVSYEPRNPASTTPGSPGGGLPDVGSLSGVVLLLLVLAGGTGAYAWTRREDAPDLSEADIADAASDEPSEDATTGGATAEETDSDDEAEPDPELLSDEERVLRLLEENDGRMKQADIVKETNWSNAKVSQLLSKMADNGDVDKLRIGRENLITLPDEDVTE